MSPSDWSAITTETVRHLQALIRLDTSNPPGNEMLAVDYLARVLRAEDIEPVIIEPTPGRGNLVARLTGTGELPPLLLYSHTDVVPAEPQYWTHPPFSGDIADGCVWGRGAVDMKGTVAQQLMVLLLLKRLQVPLKRDVIFAATADEEIGGADGCGISWVIQHHPDLLRAEFGLTELGGYNVEFNGRTLYPIQVAEKGVCWIKMRVRGQPGHGSQPHANNAVVHLARAIDRLATHGLPYHLTEAAAGFLDAACQAVDEPTRTALQQLQSAEGAQAMLNGALSQHPYWPMFNAILHNTAAPTGLSAGYKANVIPGMAEATLDGRLLPGFDAEMFLDEVQALVGPGFELTVILTSPPVQTPIATPLFETMARALKRHDPAGQPVPYMMSAATDAKHLARLGVPSYGFAPMQLPPGMKFMEMFHAHDERAPIEGLGWGVQVLFDVVREYCGG